MIDRVESDSALELPGLVRIRRERGRSQQDLANKSGVSKSTILRIEKGYKARITSAGKLAEALETTVKELSGGTPVAGRTSSSVTPLTAPAERSPRVVLALAHRRGGDDDGEDLVEILGGADALGDLQKLLEDSRGGVLAGVGLRDCSDAPRLAPGEGLSDEIEAQRDARHI